MKRIKILVLASILLFAWSHPFHAQTSPVPVAGWNVTFSFTGEPFVRQLRFMSFAGGTGKFFMTVSGPTTQSQAVFPAVWDQVTTSLMSFSGEVEFPIGNCCRETGTLVFKGTRAFNGSMSGPVIFVTNQSGPTTTTPASYVIKTGTFTALPIPIASARGQ